MTKAAENPPLLGIFRSRVMAALSSLFNLLMLNLVFLVVCLPVVTVPIAVNGAWTALDRWRAGGEDRVAREFLIAIRSGPVLRTTLLVGVPLAVTALTVEEVHYFIRGDSLGARICFGLGLAAFVIALTSVGYILLFVARRFQGQAGEIWSLAIRLAVRNLFVTGPLFLVEIVVAALLALLDPPLLIIGLPVALFWMMRLTAQFGLRRAERGPTFRGTWTSGASGQGA
jgi:hypothetical protein